MKKIRIINLLICMGINFTVLLSQDETEPNQENPDLHKIEVKEELPTWDDLYKKSIGIGFGSSTPMNDALIEFNDNMTKSNKLLSVVYRNFKYYDIDNNRFYLSLIGSTEQFYLLNNLSVWQLIEYPFMDIMKIGFGPGITTVLYNLEFVELAFGFLFDINSPLPLALNETSFVIGLRYQSIFTNYKNSPIQELHDKSSGVFNCYLSVEYNIDSFKISSLVDRFK